MFKDYSRIGLPVDDDELEAMIEAAAQNADKAARTKGSTRQQLAGREEKALKMLRANLPLREQQRIWQAAGIQTTAPSLRLFFKRYYPEEWAAYLARTARGQLKNRLLDEPSGAEKEEIRSFQEAPTKLLEKPKKQVAATPVANPQDAQEKLEQLQMVEREVSATTDDAVAWDLIASRLPWLAEKVKENRVKSYINARMFISSETKSLETSLRLK